jgi:hypothetical protein
VNTVDGWGVQGRAQLYILLLIIVFLDVVGAWPARIPSAEKELPSLPTL